jgi:molybdenum-dependent DNA-binding transcriptional regulator ModE
LEPAAGIRLGSKGKLNDARPEKASWNSLMLSTRHLECFISIAETGSFSNAVIRLGWSQPVPSRYVKELEEELKVKLLYRDGRGVLLTEAGQRGVMQRFSSPSRQTRQ